MATFTQNVARDVAAHLGPSEQTFRISNVLGYYNQNQRILDIFYPHLGLRIYMFVHDRPSITVEFTCDTRCNELNISHVLVVGARRFVLIRDTDVLDRWVWIYRMMPEEREYCLGYEPEQDAYLSVTHHRPPQFQIVL